MSGWALVALGRPAPQGSKRHVGNGIMVEQSVHVKPWREAVKAAAPPGPRLDGPLAVAMVFTMPRPKSARKADTVPCKTPDLSKLARATEDAITDAGLWADDARVAEYARLAKVWTGYDPDALCVPGVVVAAVTMDPGWHHELHEYLACALLAHQWAWGESGQTADHLRPGPRDT